MALATVLHRLPSARRLPLLIAILGAMALVVPAGASAAVTRGALTQLTGATGCLAFDALSEDGAGTCTDVRHLKGASDLLVSPDGLNVYVSQYYDPYGITSYRRDPATGTLTQLGGTDGCLTQTGASIDDGAATCANGRDIYAGEGHSLAISPDGAYVYGNSYKGGITVFHRDAATGALTQLPGLQGCISYDGSSDDGPGTCTDGHGQYYPYGLALSPDGRTLYQAEYDRTLTVYDVDQSTGALTQLPGTEGCFSTDSKGTSSAPGENVAGICTDVRGIGNTYSVAVSPEGNTVYATGYTEHGTIGVFSRQAAASCSAATATAEAGTSVTVTLPCADPNGDAVTRTITTQPAHGALAAVAGDTVTYTPADGFTGTDTFTFTGDDGGGAGAAGTATATVTVKDTTKPKLTLLTGKKDAPRLTKSGIRLRLKVSEKATIKGAVTLSSSSAKKAHLAKTKIVTIASASVKAGRATTVTLVLKPTKKAKRALLKLKGKALKKFTPKLTVTAKDAVGNTGTLSKSKLKIVR